MPPGRHSIQPSTLGDKKPVKINVDVKEELVPVLTHHATQILQGGHKLFIDFNHNEDRGAAGHVKGFYWAGDDPVTGGIRASVDWTSKGKEALQGKIFTRFSPMFTAKSTGEITGLFSANVGGLTNRPAFASNEEIVTATEQTTEEMNEEEIKKLILTAVASAVAEHKVAAMDGSDEKSEEKDSKDKQIEALKAELAEFKKKQDEDATKATEALLATAKEIGLVPAKNKDAADEFLAQAKASPEMAKRLIDHAQKVKGGSPTGFPMAATASGPIVPDSSPDAYAAAAMDATSRIESKVSAYQAQYNCDVDTAMNAVQASEPGLFALV